MRFSTLRGRDANKATRDLNTGLTRRMSLDDQFNSFVAVVDIAANSEGVVINKLRDVGGNFIIPGEWSVIDAVGAPTGSLSRGPTAWTKNKLYIQNTSSAAGQFKIRFFSRPVNTNVDPTTQQLTSSPSTITPTNGARFLTAFLLLGG